MSKVTSNSRKNSAREKQHAEMLKKALARPGLREVMKVFDDWQEQDSELDVYRSATKEPELVTTTTHSNIH